MPDARSSRGAVLLSGAALLSFLSRTLLDNRYVYEEMHLATGPFGWATLATLAFYGLWIWAIVRASHGSRPALFGLLAFDALLVLFGVMTLVSLCPSPCQVAWPVAETAVWSNLVIGVPAIFAVALRLGRGVA